MQSSTGQAAWQIEQANAPKQLFGSITATLRGAFFRGVFWSFVHMDRDYTSAAVMLYIDLPRPAIGQTTSTVSPRTP